jgi:hypothetical protein
LFENARAYAASGPPLVHLAVDDELEARIGLLLANGVFVDGSCCAVSLFVSSVHRFPAFVARFALKSR